MLNFKDRVTIYEVAKAANVSLATVSRVINNRGNVTEATKQKVEETIARLGYKPSSLAQGLATSKTTNIAILLPDANYVYISNMLSGMIDVGRIYGYRTSVFTLDSDADSSSIVDNIITSRCDGAILLGNQLTNEDINRLVSYNVPTIIIGSTHTADKIGSVNIDYKTHFKDVIKSYLDKGIEDICFLQYKSESMYFLNNMKDVIVDVFKEYGKDYNNFIYIDDSQSGTYVQFKEAFSKNEFHKVYIAPRDSLAVSISNAAHDLGIKVPEKFEVLGIIGTKYSQMARPQISSFNVDMYEVGSVAARMLTKLLAGELANKEFTLLGEYVERDTTK